MSTFDPFTATMEDALALPDCHAVRGPVWQRIGAERLLSHRAHYEASPLDGVAVCLVHDLVAPDWLARAYLRGFYAVKSCDTASWDVAFGAPHRKGVQLAALRRRDAARLRVASVVHEFVQRFPDESIDALFAAAGATGSDRAPGHLGEYAAKLGVGKTMAYELYAESGKARTVAEVRQRAGYPKRATSAKFGKVAGVRRTR